MDKAAAARATIWSAVDLFSRQLVSFFITLILARLLTPADFGVAALLILAIQLCTAPLQAGIFSALVQAPAISAEQTSTIFWLNLIAGLVLGLALILVAPALAAFFGQPVLEPLLAAAAAYIVLWALSVVQSSLLVREVRFGAIAKAGIASTFVGGAAGVAAAIMGAGVWAIALQLLITAALNSLLLWFLSDWRPAALLRPGCAGEMFRYGRWVTVSHALEVGYTQGFGALIGKLHGVRELGLFNRAQNLQQLPSASITTIIARVALPLFSRRADEPLALGRAVRMANRGALLINAPIMVGLALLAEPTMLVLFGPQWTPAAPVLTVLAFAGLLLPISAINLQVLLATGRSDSFFRNEIAKKLVGVAFVAIGSFFGIMGLAWAQLIFNVVALAMNLRTVAQVTSYTLVPQLRDLADILLPLAAMSVAVVAVEALVTGSPFVMLPIAVVAGGLVYGLTGLGLRLPSFMEGLDLLPPRLRRLVPRTS